MYLACCNWNRKKKRKSTIEKLLSWCSTKFSELTSKEMYGNEKGELICRSWVWKDWKITDHRWRITDHGPQSKNAVAKPNCIFLTVNLGVSRTIFLVCSTFLWRLLAFPFLAKSTRICLVITHKLLNWTKKLIRHFSVFLSFEINSVLCHRRRRKKIL